MKYLAFVPSQSSNNFTPHPWIDIYDLTSSGAREVRKINIGYDWFLARYSQDFSRTIILGTDTRGIRIYDMTTGQELKWIDISGTGVQGYPYTLTISPDDNRAATGYLNGMIQIWDLTTGKLLFTLAGPNATISLVQFSPVGALLAVGTREDSIVRIWDLASSTVIKELKSNFFPLGKFSPDGKTILVAQGTKAVLYDLKTFQPVYAFSGHASDICDLSISPDGRYLETTDFNQVIKIWDTDTRKEALTFSGGYTAWFAPDSKHLIVLQETNPSSISGYFLDINDLMQLARSRLVRTWTQDECQKFLYMDTCPPTP